MRKLTTWSVVVAAIILLTGCSEIERAKQEAALAQEEAAKAQAELAKATRKIEQAKEDARRAEKQAEVARNAESEQRRAAEMARKKAEDALTKSQEAERLAKDEAIQSRERAAAVALVDSKAKEQALLTESKAIERTFRRSGSNIGRFVLAWFQSDFRIVGFICPYARVF